MWFQSLWIRHWNKSKVDIWQNFVAFSEYMNFTVLDYQTYAYLIRPRHRYFQSWVQTTSLFSIRNLPMWFLFSKLYTMIHGLRTSREEIAFAARLKIYSHSQIFRYGRSIFCLPDRPGFSDIFDLCHHRVSVVRDTAYFWKKYVRQITQLFLFKSFDNCLLQGIQKFERN